MDKNGEGYSLSSFENGSLSSIKNGRNRREVLSPLIEAVQECQTRFGGKKELATGDDKRVKKLCAAWETCLKHGLLSRPKFNNLTSNDFEIDIHRPSLEKLDFWQVLLEKLGASSLDRFRRLKHVQTNDGRVRAWLRSSLNEKSLEKYLKTLLSDRLLLSQFYEEWSILRETDNSQLIHLSSGLASIAFAIVIDDEELDTSSLSINQPSSHASPVRNSSQELTVTKGALVKSGSASQPAELFSPSSFNFQKKLSHVHRSHSLGSFSLEETESDMGSMPLLNDIDSPGLPILQSSGSRGRDDMMLSQSVGSAEDYILPSGQYSAEDLLRLPSLFNERTQGDGSSTSSDHHLPPVDENLSVTELKQAVISVMLKKEEIEEENRSLRSRLEDEEQFTKGLKEELANIKHESEGKQQLDAEKIKSLLKDNELLRNQLKKYITAVQMLQYHGPNAENLGIHHSEPQPALLPSKLQEETSGEAYEYKQKLIQVAEMHGELMEFIEYIQRRLKFNEDLVKNLAVQLTELRGPLPITLEAYLNSTTSPSEERPWQTLVNIWIPSVFLKGTESRSFHVYQVFMRIKDEEWNVYRRYSQFYKFWKELKAKHSLISTFDFPPKKALGKRDSRLVEDRRRRLQDFLRKSVQHIIADGRLTTPVTDRASLSSAILFFGENYS